MVKASASGVEDLEFDSRFRCGEFSGSSHTSDLKIGTPVASVIGSAMGPVSLVSVYCGWVRDSLISNFCLRVAACIIA